MEAGSENEPQDDPVFVRNPTGCTARITRDKLPNSPFLSSLGFMADIVVYRIQRHETKPTFRSPWRIKNMNKRLECSVRYFYLVMLEKEAQVVRKLSCPNIVGAVSLGGLDLYKQHLAMEYCSQALADILSARYNARLGPLEAAKARKVALAVLGALDYLHTKVHMMHGDMKSTNILVDEAFEKIKLCGFGPEPKTLTSGGTLESGVCVDSIAIGMWTAPEVFDSTENISAKADVYSFGLVVYEMLACMPPHTFPGIMDSVIASPKQLKNLRDGQNDGDTKFDDDTKDEEEMQDEDHVVIKGNYQTQDDETLDYEEIQDGEDIQDDADDEMNEDGSADVAGSAIKETVFARKRKSPPTAYTATAKKQLKFDEVIIDLVDEEDPMKDESIAKGNDRSGEDSLGKENKPVDNENNPTGKESDTVGKESDTGGKENDTAGKGNDTIRKEKDTIGKENNIGKDNDTIEKENEAVVKQNDAIVKQNDTVVKENDAVVKEKDAVVKENDAVVKENNDAKIPSENEKNTNEQKASSEATEISLTTPIDVLNDTAEPPPKVESSTDPIDKGTDKNAPAVAEATDASATAPVETPITDAVVSTEVVTVFDSSDEEDYPPIKSYEVVESSESGDFDTDEDDRNVQFSEVLPGGYYDATEEEEFFEVGDDESMYNDEGSDTDGCFLNYESLGTRPPLPGDLPQNYEYDRLVEMFYVCTINNHALRPSAGQILQAYQDNKQTTP